MADTLKLTLDVPGVPKADDKLAKGVRDRGERDPSLVEVPGLGSFQNGKSHDVPTVRVIEAARLFTNPDNPDLALPAGVKLSGKNKVAVADLSVPGDVTYITPFEVASPQQAEGHPVTTVKTPDVPETDKKQEGK